MKFKILDVQWHIGHQYENAQIPVCRVELADAIQASRFSKSIRGDIGNMFEYVCCYEPGVYDAAILHLDQDCLDPLCGRLAKDRL